jgi:uncharacterized protein YkwD
MQFPKLAQMARRTGGAAVLGMALCSGFVLGADSSSSVVLAAGGMQYHLVVPGVSHDGPQPTPAPEVTPEPDTGIDAYGGRMVADLINQKRAELGLRQLKYNAPLTAAGEKYAQVFYDHYDTFTPATAHILDGKEPWQRAREAGYTGAGYAGDNIAVTSLNIPREKWVIEIVQVQLDSPGHRALMMDSNTKDIGVGCLLQYKVSPFNGRTFKLKICDLMFGLGN